MSGWIKVGKIKSFIKLGRDQIGKLDKYETDEHDKGYIKGITNVLDGLQRLLIDEERGGKLYYDQED